MLLAERKTLPSQVTWLLVQSVQVACS